MYILTTSRTTVDLNVVLIMLGILILLIVGALLIMLLMRLNKTLSVINGIVKRREKDIERLIAILPEATENISDMTHSVKNVADSVCNITDRVKGSVDALSPANIMDKIGVIFQAAKKAFSFARQHMSAKADEEESTEESSEECNDHEE